MSSTAPITLIGSASEFISKSSKGNGAFVTCPRVSATFDLSGGSTSGRLSRKSGGRRGALERGHFVSDLLLLQVPEQRVERDS